MLETFENMKKLAELLTHKQGLDIFTCIASNEKVTYTELKKIASNETNLKRRLDELKELKLIKRKIKNDKYKPTLYFITKKGLQVFKIIEELDKTLIK